LESSFGIVVWSKRKSNRKQKYQKSYTNDSAIVNATSCAAKKMKKKKKKKKMKKETYISRMIGQWYLCQNGPTQMPSNRQSIPES
jgi:hypothetical protein